MGHTYFWICNLQDRLAKVLALKHTNESLWSIIDAFSNAHFRLEGSLMKPLCNVLVTSLPVLWSHIFVSDNKSFQDLGVSVLLLYIFGADMHVL